MPEIQIMPSILAADIGHLADECLRAENAGGDALHVDIMDAHFVNNLSLSPAVVKMAQKTVKIPLHVHLMMLRPDLYADPFMDAGADTLMIHVEADCDPRPVLEHIRSRDVTPAIVLNPETPAEAARPFLDAVDEVLVMSVHPGFGGQAFIPQVLPTIEQIRSWAPEIDISVDGGINQETAEQCARAGANILVVGSFFFASPNMEDEISLMRERTTTAFAAASA